ncbi:hypothetical protein EYC84_005817 [Monilinia fructicola]|uniref:ACT domain-containing protein n=1 Tax=Monilinia fructicola TaxID=38448 RepID=A0A5M9K0A5_MONFR|nr:hypothetical protein EYC84_005817 [Monilinia fructicola]
MSSRKAILSLSGLKDIDPLRLQLSNTNPSIVASHRFPTADAPPAWSAQAAVSNILYETPAPSATPAKRHVLNCLVQNEPGVLSRVSGILAARGFNIDSLVVCSTEVEDLSRMTIVLSGQDGVVEQARRQLEDLVPVWAVLDYTTSPLVQRELLLAKINLLGPEYFEELRSHTSRINSVEKVLDISTHSCIVEVSAKPTRIDSFMKLIAPFGILESARTGLMALPRSPLYGPNEQDNLVKDAEEIVDASTLPPGLLEITEDKIYFCMQFCVLFIYQPQNDGTSKRHAKMRQSTLTHPNLCCISQNLKR